MTLTTAKFTRNPDLSRYDKEAKKVIRHALDKGWVGCEGSKGHMVLRAPDGETTAAIQRDLSAPHARGNAWAPIKAWEKRVAQPIARDERGNLVLKCSKCDFEAAHKMALVTHMTVNHSEPRICPVCDRKYATQAGYMVHIKSSHPELNRKYIDKGVADEEEITEPEEFTVFEESPEPEDATAPEEPAVSEDDSTVSEEVALTVATFPTFPDDADYDNWTTDQLVHAMREMTQIAQALKKRLDGQFTKIEIVREALSL